MLTQLGGSRHITMPIFFKTGLSKASAIFQFSKWPLPPFFICKIAIFWLTGSSGSRLNSMSNFSKIRQSVAKILNVVKISRFVAEILRFFEFSRWPPPPSWIFKIAKFYWLLGCDFSRWRPPPSWIVEFAILFADGVWRPRRTTVPNFVKIDRSIAEILRFLEFSKMATAVS